MVNLFSSFRRLSKQSVMVIGDLMLDTYTIGKASRISPEAPVPVLHVQTEEHRPGGAGNVALNLAAMGAETLMVGRVGADDHGKILIDSLKREGVQTNGIWIQTGCQTAVKNRVIADNQQMVRVDYETALPLHEAIEQQIIEALPTLLESIKVVAISDYGKGMITKTLMAAVIEECLQRNIPIIADPKGIDFTKYRKATVVKPNLGEVYAAANLPMDAPLEAAAQRVLEITQAEVLMVTRSEEGISLFYQSGKREDFPVRAREVVDVTGAGDTVLAMLTIALANQLTVSDATRLSNVAAGVAVSHFGCARVTLAELARQLLSEDVGNKVFDEEHLFALQEALKGREFAILSLSSKEGIGTDLFEAIRKVAQKKSWDLVVHIEDENPSPIFVDVIASLHDVDYIIVKRGGLEYVSKLLFADEIFSFS